MPALLRTRARDDDGIGMILVIATVGIVTALMVLATTVSVQSLTSSRKHVSFESALSVAESGVDAGLSRSYKTYTTSGTDSYAAPSVTDPTCPGASVAWPFSTQPTPDQERSWAKSQLTTLALTAGCRNTTRGGDFVLLKPTGRQTVYAMGFSPRYGANEVKARMLKAEYIFAPYAPANAILTAGDVELGSSTTVTTAPPSSPTLAKVHANGNVTVSTGNPTVYGAVSQSGTGTPASSNNFTANTSGTVTNTVRQSIPPVGALSVWGANHLSNPPGGWYDLCSNGEVRSPDGATPCAGSLLATNSWRGWTYDGTAAVKKWIATSAIKVNSYSGTYYINGGDVIDSSGNAGGLVPNFTVIAAAQTLTCAKVGGNISWDHIDLASPSVPNLFMLADQDLLTTSNFSAGSDVAGTVVSGLFIAGDQVQMETSSNGAYGAVIAADVCDPANGTSLVDSNIIKNPSIYFDPNAHAPFTDIVNTTLWLEYGT